MEYNLWDVEVGKQLGHFTEERDALILVRKLVAHYGDEYAHDLGLGRKTDGGGILEPLSGAALLARMREVIPAPDLLDDRQEVAAVLGRLIRRRGEGLVCPRLDRGGRHLAPRS